MLKTNNSLEDQVRKKKGSFLTFFLESTGGYCVLGEMNGRCDMQLDPGNSVSECKPIKYNKHRSESGP